MVEGGDESVSESRRGARESGFQGKGHCCWEEILVIGLQGCWRRAKLVGTR